jgi:3-oxo-5alpha-steroid 4-dehydrogenase
MFKRLGELVKRFDSCETQIQAAIVASDQSVSWSQSCDVVVAGFGGAGASAALEAHDNGASVMVLERYNGGGSTRISGGVSYSGGGTDIQKNCGIEDSADNLYEYLKEQVKGVVSDETLRDFSQQSVANFDWMREIGVSFKASLCTFKTSYPIDKYYLYFSGNESFPPYNNRATASPRGHRAFGGSGIMLASGSGFFEPFRQACLARGINVCTQARVEQLVTDENTQVLGVRVTILPEGSVARKIHQKLYWLVIYLRYLSMYVPIIQGLLRRTMNMLENRCGKAVFVRARNGVILSTGGYYFNNAMIKQYAPKYYGGMGLGTIGDDGSGIKLGQSINAKTELLGNVSAWRFINPPESFTRGVLVGSQGTRFCNEALYGAQIGEQMFADNDAGKGYLIIDKKLWRQCWKELGPGRATWFQVVLISFFLLFQRKKAGSLATLAGKLGVSSSNLMATVAGYNELAASALPDPMGKPKEFIAALTDGPFYAIDCSYKRFFVPCPSITVGGLKVDEKTGAVLGAGDDKGGVIKGLYAAGRTAVGIPSRSYVSGLSLADCVYSGRRAGRHAGASKINNE